jgi:hypothetical protein
VSSLHDVIKDKVVEPMLRDRQHMIRGRVTRYNHIMNRATVVTNNRYGLGKKEFHGVPVQIGSGGVHSAGPFEGQDVWMTFVGGNILHPRIVSLADENYQFNTRESLRHRRKGALIPDSLVRF